MAGLGTPQAAISGELHSRGHRDRLENYLLKGIQIIAYYANPLKRFGLHTSGSAQPAKPFRPWQVKMEKQQILIQFHEVKQIELQ